MSDLHTRLNRFAGPVAASATSASASAEVIAADLARGHRAVRRRRTVQVAAGSVFTVAALAAAVAFTGTTPPDVAATPPVAASAAALRLVDYRGEQPRFFTIDKVPEGFFVQKDYYGGLTIAPDSARDPGPNVDPSTSPIYDPNDFTGKIAIYLEQAAFRGPLDGDKVTVAGKEAIVHPIGATTQLIIAVSPQVYATVQADVPLTRDQLLELGAGLHVHQDAVDRMAAGTPTGK
jgi:hypothetical protein